MTEHKQLQPREREISEAKANARPDCNECKGDGWLMTGYGFPILCPFCFPPGARP